MRIWYRYHIVKQWKRRRATVLWKPSLHAHTTAHVEEEQSKFQASRPTRLLRMLIAWIQKFLSEDLTTFLVINEFHRAVWTSPLLDGGPLILDPERGRDACPLPLDPTILRMYI